MLSGGGVKPKEVVDAKKENHRSHCAHGGVALCVKIMRFEI